MSPGKLRASRVRLGQLGLLRVARLQQTARYARAATTNLEQAWCSASAASMACISPRRGKTRVSSARGVCLVLPAAARLCAKRAPNACPVVIPRVRARIAAAPALRAAPARQLVPSTPPRASGVPGGTSLQVLARVCVSLAPKAASEMLAQAAIYRAMRHIVSRARKGVINAMTALRIVSTVKQASIST